MYTSIHTITNRILYTGIKNEDNGFTQIECNKSANVATADVYWK